MKIKFLIIRFSSIGDIVLTTPIIRCLKKQIAAAEVQYVTKKQYATIVTSNPYIDKVHILDDSLSNLINELKDEKFDYVIDLHHNIRSFILKIRLRVVHFSFNKINFEKWLMVAFKKNILPKKHIVDRYFDTLYLFDVQNDNKGLDFFIELKNEIDLRLLPSVFHNGYVVIVIGARHFTKQLPDDKIAQMCNEIELPVILLGGPDDTEKAKNIISISGSIKVFNACGGYNLQQSASLIKQASKVITHDTGLMHIASAFKKIIISVWGNTIPEFGMYPYMTDQASFIFEVKNLKCRPCSKLGYTKCPKKHFDCMNKQDIKGIIELCNKNV